MNTNVVQFPPRPIGMFSELPNLSDLCASLRKNWAVLDEIDKGFARLILRVGATGDSAKIETVAECRAIAWSILTRYGLVKVTKR